MRKWGDVAFAVFGGVLIAAALLAQSSVLDRSQIRAEATELGVTSRIYPSQIRTPQSGDPLAEGLYWVRYNDAVRVAAYLPDKGDGLKYRWLVMDVDKAVEVSKVTEWRRLPE